MRSPRRSPPSDAIPIRRTLLALPSMPKKYCGVVGLPAGRGRLPSMPGSVVMLGSVACSWCGKVRIGVRSGSRVGRLVDRWWWCVSCLLHLKQGKLVVVAGVDVSVGVKGLLGLQGLCIVRCVGWCGGWGGCCEASDAAPFELALLIAKSFRSASHSQHTRTHPYTQPTAPPHQQA